MNQVKTWYGEASAKFKTIEEFDDAQCTGVEWAGVCGMLIDVPCGEACVVVVWRYR